MQRRVLISLAAGIVAVAIGVIAIFQLANRDDTTEVAIITPIPSETAVETPKVAGVVETPSATVTTSPAATTEASATTPASTVPAVRSASSVDCGSAPDKKYCSVRHGMKVEDGKFETYDTNDKPAFGANDARITMRSTVRQPDNTKAGPGDRASSIHVEVLVENKTDKTFVFPNREIEFDLYRNGALYDTLRTHGPGFEMTPGGNMTGTFDRPITADGTYTWRAKTWYYEK